MSDFKNILIFGCGNMGGAMLTGWLAAGIEPARFTIVDPALAEAPESVRLLREVPSEESFEAILLGVKPQLLGDVAPKVEPLAGQGTVMLSILAGVELETLATHFPRAGAIVRVMPNLAAALGKSPIALIGAGLSDQPPGKVDALMAPLGQVEWLESEQLMDLVTALAGSGPAFVYRFIDALAAGAKGLGLPSLQAERLAVAMVEGAGALAAASAHSPGELARRVASPGGVTQVGLDILDEGDSLALLVAKCLRGAADRSAEMAEEARSQG